MSSLGDLLVPAPLAPPGSLAADFALGRRKCLDLFPPGAVSLARPAIRQGSGASACLSAEDFGVTTPQAGAKLRRILAGEGVLVTTGQQPVLFLGPLYVLYKTLSAIETARRIEARNGVPALACFWIAADDSDWQEVGAAYLIGPDNELVEFRVEPQADRAAHSVGPSPLPTSIRDTVDGFVQRLGRSEFVDKYITLIQDAYRPGASYTEAFAALLHGLLAPRELAWIDSAGPAVRGASRDLLAWVLREAEAAGAAFSAATRAVARAGYPPQLQDLEGATPVFFDTGAGRERVYRSGEVVRLGRKGPTLPLAELLGMLEEAPHRFGPAASLRPVLESSLLPVAASILGPAEIAYWAQLGGLFDLAGVAMPMIRPRGTWRVIERKVRKVLEKAGATPEDFSDGGRELGRRIVAEGRPPAVEGALAAFHEDAAASLERLREAIEKELPGIKSAVGKARAEVFRVAEEIERLIDARVRGRREILLRQLRKAAVHLYPAGKPQERILSPFYYLARYGDAFVDEIARCERAEEEAIPAHIAGVGGQE
ncbi:MAG: bacillithiol biosynthesis cysteine-adding enzyme BshC [Gemmatimonadota bacterium]